jgi:hypothetical protein
MPMGIVSDSDFDLEKSRLKREESKSVPTPIPSATIIDMNKGRGNGNLNVPDTLRKVIGETAVVDGRQEAVELARQFGISPSSASAYGVGANSTATYDERPNLSVVNEARIKVQRRARNKLMQALSNITADKLKDTKARDLAGIAKDMSVVIKNFEPETPEGDKGDKGPQFVFFAPQFKDERSFDTIYVKE